MLKIDYGPFQSRLRQLIKGSGKSMNTLAEDLGMSTPTLSRYLSGNRTPDLPYIFKISEYFNISIDWLLGVNGEKYEVMPPEVQEIAELYSVATPDDKKVVQAVLEKYKIGKEETNAEQSPRSELQ